MVIRFFVEGRRQTLLYSCKWQEWERSEKSAKQLSAFIARNRTITKQRTLKHETNKTDRNPPITNHKPGPFELVQVNMCFLRGPLRWLREQKTQNSLEVCKTHSDKTNFAVKRDLLLKTFAILTIVRLSLRNAQLTKIFFRCELVRKSSHGKLGIRNMQRPVLLLTLRRPSWTWPVNLITFAAKL